MKRVFLALGLVFAISVPSIQAQTFTDIFDNLAGYDREKKDGNEENAIMYLLAAKDVIDKMEKEPNNLALSKFWKRRGDIYYVISVETSPRVLLEKETAPLIALESFIKALHVEVNAKGKPKVEEKDDLLVKLQNTGVIFDQQASDKFTAKDFKGAYVLYEIALRAYDELAKTKGGDYKKYVSITVNNMVACSFYGKDCAGMVKLDSLVMATEPNVESYSLLITCHYELGNKDKAAALFAKIKKEFPNNHQVYLTELDFAMAENDYDKVAKILEEANAKFPDKRTDFIIAEVNIHLEQGNNEKAIEAMELAIETNKDKEELVKQLIFNSAVIYAQMGNKSLDSNKQEEGIGYIRKSVEACEKYLAKDPKEMRMVSQLGNNHIQIGTTYNNEANALSEEGPEWDALKAKAKEAFLKAIDVLLPYYNETKDDFTKKQLTSLYYHTGQRDKGDQMKAQ